ncbi:MAG TPA: cytochrome c [Gaiellaceae bacterium]|nr:cytochrome c [Gaiellaceae bacterium]
MLSTIDVVVAGLSAGHKIGLAAVGIAFIVFALVSSFLLTRRNPDFPGKRGLGWYVVLCIAFFVAMMAAVLVFGKESKEATGPVAQTTTASSTPAPTTTAATPAVQGDPVAGKAVFASAGCNGCHTLKAAGATGTVGPNLDSLKPAYDRIVRQVEVGGGPMPAFKGRLTDAQIHDVAAFVYTSTH